MNDLKPYASPFVGPKVHKTNRGKKPIAKRLLGYISIIFMRINGLSKRTKIIIGGVILLLIIVLAILALTGFFKSRINKKFEVANDGVHLYINTNAGFTARFGYLSGDKFQHLVQYETKQKETITMQLLDAKEDMKVYKTTVTDNNQKEEIDVIKFDGVYDKTNVYYQVTNTRIKEVIVLINDSAPSTFKYSVVTSGVELEKINEGKGGYIFKANNNTVFGIPPLFMKDANNEISYEVESKITFVKDEGGEKIYELEVIPSLSWLKDTARAFPIQIDPSIVNLGN